jgi:hypothetical protein
MLAEKALAQQDLDPCTFCGKPREASRAACRQLALVFSSVCGQREGARHPSLFYILLLFLS